MRSTDGVDRERTPSAGSPARATRDVDLHVDPEVAQDLRWHCDVEHGLVRMRSEWVEPSTRRTAILRALLCSSSTPTPTSSAAAPRGGHLPRVEVERELLDPADRSTASRPDVVAVAAGIVMHRDRVDLARASSRLRDEAVACDEPLAHYAAQLVTHYPDRPARRVDVHEPASVRRAALFIDDHAHLPISYTDIVDAAHVGRRALQAAFRTSRGLTPTGYLRQVRLHRAHHDLVLARSPRVADPHQGSTVAAIARKWHFNHPGRFSIASRDAYGCSPRHTLRA